MDEQRVKTVVGGDGVAEVALARPDKLNALDPEMFQAIVDAIEGRRGDARVRAVVLHGEGRAFCSGLDKGSFEAMLGGTAAFGDITRRTHGLANLWQQVAWGWRDLPVPVVAAVHGVAYGGGLQVALGADVRIVHPGTRLSVMEIRWGIVPDMAGNVFMAELLRPDVARELTFSGREVDAQEAVALGLATRMADDPLAEARSLARQIAGRNPDAARAAKRLLNGASPVQAAGVLLAEAREQAALIGSPNQVEAVMATLQKRAAVLR
ncbi:MAG: crotonase/enoyl-CoA hydratase family protein [Comamonadaceae bacterium]|nr:MAG: crotonase/enoyl-CoA hydratase family protein [Comamonadaceae bacterium]